MSIKHFSYDGIYVWGIKALRWGNVAIELGRHQFVINWDRA